MGNLGTGVDGATDAEAVAVNNAGVAVGSADKYSAGANVGQRAVRWDSTSGAATELEQLGTNANGATTSAAFAVNDRGVVVGYATKYASSLNVGTRAVRWDDAGVATELANLGTDAGGRTNSSARDVNIAGTAVGSAAKYVAGNFNFSRAVIWLPNGSIIDLNVLGILPTPESGAWQLRDATSLSADGWIVGTGMFNPNGQLEFNGPPAVERLWVAQIGLGGEWTDDFTGSLDGAWGRGPQWSTGTPAMQMGAARFNINAAYTVQLDRNERTRTIDISAGVVTLETNGFSLEAIDGATVSDGATLGGVGTIRGDVSVGSGGSLAPGASPGTLDFDGRLTLDPSARLQFDLNGTDTSAGSGVNDLIVARDLTLDGILNLVETTPGSFQIASLGDSLRLFDYSGELTNRGLALGNMPALGSPNRRFVVDASTDGQVNLLIAVVPEPGAAALLAGAGLGILWVRRRHS